MRSAVSSTPSRTVSVVSWRPRFFVFWEKKHGHGAGVCELRGCAIQSAGAHARVEPLGDYCQGLMLFGDRKSVEPMAALVAPQRASAKQRAMHHVVAEAGWSDAALLTALRREVLPALGAIEAWIVDDTGNPKNPVRPQQERRVVEETLNRQLFSHVGSAQRKNQYDGHPTAS